MRSIIEHHSDLQAEESSQAFTPRPVQHVSHLHEQGQNNRRKAVKPSVATSQILFAPSAACRSYLAAAVMVLDTFYHNKIESMKLEIIQGQAVLRRLEAQRNDYNSRVRLLREELGLLQQPGSYVGEVVKVMGTKKVLVKVHPEGKYGTRFGSL